MQVKWGLFVAGGVAIYTGRMVSMLQSWRRQNRVEVEDGVEYQNRLHDQARYAEMKPIMEDQYLGI